MGPALNRAERRLARLFLVGAALGLIWQGVEELRPPPPPVTLLRGALAPDSTGAPPLNDSTGSHVTSDVGSGENAPVDLCTAGAEELQSLPGIGPVLARRIVEWRNGKSGEWHFEDLLEVPGIGPVTLERFRSRARVGAPSAGVASDPAGGPPEGGECR